MARSLGTIKRGDTFALNAALSDNKTPIVGAADTLRCQVRKGPTSKDELVAELVITERSDLPGTYVIALDGSTRDWPKKVFFDIEYNNGTAIRSTETLIVMLEEDVTDG